MLVTVKYFGMLLEQTQKDSETFELSEHTSIEQIEALVLEQYPTIHQLTYNIALNLNIQVKSTLVNNGDELAFLPPFAGG